MVSINLVLALFAILLACNEIHASLLPTRCPVYNFSPQKTLDLSKVAGEWYLLFTGRGIPKDGLDCYKTTVTFTDNKANFQQSWFDIENKLVEKSSNSTFDPKLPGAFMAEVEEDVHGLFKIYKKKFNVNSVILNTDYENFVLSYSCYVIDHFWKAEKREHFSVSLRNRNTDLRKVIPVLKELRDKFRFDLNELQFYSNLPTCKN